MPEKARGQEIPEFNPLDIVGEGVKAIGRDRLISEFDAPHIERPAFPPDTPIIIVPDEAALKNLARPIVVVDREGYDKMREVLEEGGLL